MAAANASGAASLLTGRAYGRRATLEITGDTLTWRARRGQLNPVAENIATTTHDVRGVRWIERRWSPGGGVLAILSVIWMATESMAFGLGALLLAIALIAYRAARPRRWLALDLGGRWLLFRVDQPSAAAARALAKCIERHALLGEPPAITPTLP
ncbi:MAG: hypothetical protein H0T79_14245 [Deltaproteobacteria bacterium]|nr:hypothetical protein [Deltaproteobacteria bacterium]